MDVLLNEVTAWNKGCPKQMVLESLYNDLKKQQNKVMKANEIQIGDWVYSTFCDKPCKVVGVEQYESGYANVKVTNVSGAKDITSLTPIPLTTEILEKNGFVKGYMFNNVWNYIEDYKRLVIVYTGEVFNIQNTLIEFKHVHKLQHILKICGIEKEIEL